MIPKHSFLIGREATKSNQTIPVINPYSLKTFAEVCLAGPAEIDSAIALAISAFEITRKQPTYLRARICNQVADGIEKQKDEFAETIARESGQPLVYARAEVARNVSRADSI